MNFMTRSFHIQTFGCQMNANDSDWLARSLKARGFIESAFEEADIHIINTCSVRDKPEQKVYSELGRIARFCKVHNRRDVTVCVGGCVAQQVGAPLIRRFSQVRLLFGTDGIVHAPDAISRLMEEPGLRLSLLDFVDQYAERPLAWPGLASAFPVGADASAGMNDGAPVGKGEEARADNGAPAGTGEGRHAGRGASASAGAKMTEDREQVPASVFVNIMQGCDNFCTYCIVPFVRGRQKSRRAGAVLEECRTLLDGGAREITLLGQNVNSYGLDASVNPGEDSASPGFADLLHAVAKLPGLERLRFVTPHPKDIDPKVIAAFADMKALCPRLHLPLQSGSDRILKAMNRRYDTARYLDIVRRLKEARPDIILTTDIIVGFPGESEDDFQATMDLMREVGFASSFSFVYSDRPGARAVLLPGKVDRSIALERLSRLQEWQNQASSRVLESMKGRTVEVLIEGRSRWDALLEESSDRPLSQADTEAVAKTAASAGGFTFGRPDSEGPDAPDGPAGGDSGSRRDEPRLFTTDGGEAWQGKTPQGFIVNVVLAPRSGGRLGPDRWEGAIVPVRIEAAARHSLKGKQAGTPW